MQSRSDSAAAPRADDASRPLAAWQAVACFVAPPAAVAAVIVAGDAGFRAASIALLAFSAVVVAVKVAAVLAGLARRTTLVVEPAALADADLPRYSVLVPLYHEAEVAEALVAAMAALDYPKDKLEVLLLVEADDPETAAALAAQKPPAWMRVVVVPAGTPRTKPRACNVGLAQATGELVVVFDAEDRPEPDQLRKAVAAFRAAGSRVACLQAKLNVFNRSQHLLTRLFALEYTAWFDLYLPGLHALRAPIPLGGTSNHFRADRLRAVGGWDPWNVTEDCDLGVRLALAGAVTRILDSTTWEEAPSRWGAWLKQRSRWMKGYWQTHLVHTRHPLRTLAALGPWRTMLMLATVGGQVASLLVQPLCVVIAVAWLALRWPLYDPHHPWTVALVVTSIALLLSNLLFVAIHVLGAWQRRFTGLAPFAALLPAYWLMQSVGAWRGVLQFFRAPFLWEKTPHGLATGAATRAGDAHRRSTPLQRLATGAIVASLAALIVAAAWRVPGWLRFNEEIRFAAIDGAQPTWYAEQPVERSWIGQGAVEIAIAGVPVDPEETTRVLLRAAIHLKCWDGEWYEHPVTLERVGATALRARVPLDDGWRALDCGRPWCGDCLRRVRSCGVRLFGAMPGAAMPRLAEMTLSPAQRPLSVACSVLAAPDRLAADATFEASFALDRAYENPFDARQVELWGEFTDPAGAVTRVPAFYTQDYQRAQQGAREVLTASGLPHWAVRFTPAGPGAHRWRITGKDGDGHAIATPPATFTAVSGDRPGFVRVDGEWFTRGGAFLWPTAINIRSPVDSQNRTVGGFAEPDPAGGGLVMESFVDRLAEARIAMGRVWLSPWFGGLEWRGDAAGYHGAGRYNLQNAWRIDRLLAHARSRGVLIELALNSHGPFTTGYDSQWRDNPYNAANGGPARTPADALRDGEARRLMKERFRYVAARWGADPTLFAWTVFIEVNMVSEDVRLLTDWHRELCGYLASVDSGKHPISTEFNDDGRPPVWRLPEIAYTQNSAYCFADGMVSTFHQAIDPLTPFAKPVVLEEYGGHPHGGSTMKHLAHETHDGLWAGFMMRTAASPMTWWWNFVFAKGLTRYYARLAGFIAGEDLRGAPWSYADVEVAGSACRALVRSRADRAYAWIYAPAISDIPGPKHQPMARSHLYESRAAGFDPFAAPPGRLFAEEAGRNLVIPGLAPGRWRCEVWDTWEDAAPRQLTVTVAADGAVALPAFSRDFALKLSRLGD